MALTVVFLACAIYFVQGQDGPNNSDEPVEYYNVGTVDLLFTPAQERQMRTRSAYLTVNKWTNNTIPYVIDEGFAAIPSRKAALQQAIKDYNDNTCIRVVPRKNEPNYVKFINGGGCYSYLGAIGGEQPISYGEGCDTTRGTPVHEIMHCLGFMHEQQRPDRDDYVKINMQHVQRGGENNFVKANAKDVDLLSYYDVNSVMHYPRWAFSSTGEDTIVTKDPNLQDKIGQRKFFSPCDIAKINKFYKCGGKYKTSC